MIKVLVGVILILPFQVLAQCCSGGVPMSNNIGLPTADKGVLQFNLNYDWNNLQNLKSESSSLNDNSRQRETHSLLFELGYTITDKLSVDLFVPFIRQERTITSPLGNTDFDKTQGLGDIVILPKYALTDKVTLGVGMKIPTGDSDRSDDGITLVADLQPGSGALDGILFLAYSNYFASRQSLGYFANLIYRATGENDSYFGSSTYQFGNEFQLIAGISDRFLISKLQIDPSLKFRYREAGRDFFDENEFPSSGGSFLFINPGLAVLISPSLSWQINTSVPVYSFVNETQLSPSVQINTGLLFKINLKPKTFEL